jgi:hypothetical protein
MSNTLKLNPPDPQLIYPACGYTTHSLETHIKIRRRNILDVSLGIRIGKGKYHFIRKTK